MPAYYPTYLEPHANRYISLTLSDTSLAPESQLSLLPVQLALGKKELAYQILGSCHCVYSVIAIHEVGCAC